MISTTRITNNVKISEFSEMADALFDAINNNSERRWGILELLGKQTEAKQDKFWKFYDAFVTAKTEKVEIKVPTITIDMNEASILHAVARAYVTDNLNDMNAEQLQNWNKLFQKLSPALNC